MSIVTSNKRQSAGIFAALSSALFLGLAPVFGRMAIISGFTPLAVVALRTSLATILMFAILAIFWRKFLYIFPLGLAGCFLAGAINGLGSILYYLALGQLPASLGQMLYALYPLFVVVFSFLDKQPVSRITMVRVAVAGIAVLFLTHADNTNVPLAGVLMMIGSAALYALHIPINQRVLYEIPAPTVTLFTLLAMSIVTVPFYFIFDRQLPTVSVSWWPLVFLTLVTFASRITLFLGIKNIGGLQSAILGLAELFITIILSRLFLGEMLEWTQLLGAGILGLSIMMIAFDKQGPSQRHVKGGWLAWIHPPEIKPWSLQD